jgi:hypothetical protein
LQKPWQLAKHQPSSFSADLQWLGTWLQGQINQACGRDSCLLSAVCGVGGSGSFVKIKAINHHKTCRFANPVFNQAKMHVGISTKHVEIAGKLVIFL